VRVASAAAPRGAARLASVRRTARGAPRRAEMELRRPSAVVAAGEARRTAPAPHRSAAPAGTHWRAVGGGLLLAGALGTIVVGAALASLALTGVPN
jgi:hypothetical protein